jgi:hypothetical protein
MAWLQASSRVRGTVGIVIPMLVLITAAHTATAETELRWKFKQGDKTQYEMKMEMTQDTKAGDAPVQAKMSQVMDMTWEVKSVADDGTATLHQTIDRIRMEMTMPTGAGADFKFDSQNPEQDKVPPGIAKTFAAMVGKPFVLTVTPQGEVKDLKSPEGMVAALKGSAIGGAVTEDSLKQMISQSMMPFPAEAVSKGSTWEKSAELPAPPFGKQLTKTEYKFAGEETRDGKKFDKIDVTLDAKFETSENAPTKMKIKSNEAGGEVLWDNEAGHPVTSTIDSKMTFELTIGGMSIEQNVATKVMMNLVAPSNAREL